MMVLSWRTALARLSPPLALPEEVSGSETSWALEAAAVSIVRPGDRLRFAWLDCTSSSTQFAGVGGTGPRDDTPLGGRRRVGGEMIGMLVLSMLCTLCDLEFDGGGPGGGGGRGMPGSHLVCEVERERADVGVSRAPVEAARRDDGGTDCTPMVAEAMRPGSWYKTDGPRLLLNGSAGGCGSGELESWSLSLRRPSDGNPNRRSRDGPRPLGPGGGGKLRAAGSSGDGRCMTVVAIRGGGVDAEAMAVSKAALMGRCCRILGGL